MGDSAVFVRAVPVVSVSPNSAPSASFMDVDSLLIETNDTGEAGEA